jgi:hypothetical protein
MFIPCGQIEGAFQCPISGRKFEYRTMRQKRLAILAQQAHTSDLIIELDPDSDGVRRPLIWYEEEYRRLARTALRTGSPAVSAA